MKQVDLEKILDLSGYATEERVARRKEQKSEEFYTPYQIVKRMCDKVPQEKWEDPNADVLEPSIGNGQFVLAIIYYKIMNGSTWKQALEHTWGVELFQANVDECYNRVISMLKEMDIQDFSEIKARRIMKNNLVCSDFFKWDFENWCPIKEPKVYKTELLF